MILSKDQIKYLTREITPEESQYVAQVSNIFNTTAGYDTNTGSPMKDEVRDIVILGLNKLKSFHVKFDETANKNPYDYCTSEISNIRWTTGDLVDRLLPVVRGIFNIGPDETIFCRLDIPVDTDPLVLINDLKDAVYELINYIKAHEETFSDISIIRKRLEEYAVTVCEFCYRIRLAKSNYHASCEHNSNTINPYQ